MSKKVMYFLVLFIFVVFCYFLLAFFDLKKRKEQWPNDYKEFVNSCKRIYDVKFEGKVIKIERIFWRTPFHKVHVKLTEINAIGDLNGITLLVRACKLKLYDCFCWCELVARTINPGFCGFF